MSHIDLNLIVLLVLLACGIFSHNSAVTIAAGVLIVFRITPLSEFFPYLQQHGLNIGIIILTIGVLTPIASGKIPGEAILKSFMSWKSLLAIAIGLLVARRSRCQIDDQSTRCCSGVVDWHGCRCCGITRCTCWAFNCRRSLDAIYRNIINIGIKILNRENFAFKFAVWFAFFVSYFHTFLNLHILINALNLVHFLDKQPNQYWHQ